MVRTSSSHLRKITLLARTREHLDPGANQLRTVFSRKMKSINLPKASLSSIGRSNQSQAPKRRATSQALSLPLRSKPTARSLAVRVKILRRERMKMKFPLNHLHPTKTKLLKSRKAQSTQARRRVPRKEVRRLRQECLSLFIQDR